MADEAVSRMHELLIPLSSLACLDLRPGETLLITAHSDQPATVRAVWEAVNPVLAEAYPDCRVIVVPKGTTAEVIRPHDAA